MLTKAKQVLGRVPVFLLLVPLFFIYSGYNELFGFLSFSFIIKNTAFILAGVIAVYALGYFLLKQQDKAAVFSVFISVSVLGFGFLHDSLKKVTANSIITSFTIVIPVLLALYILCVILLKKYSAGLKELFFFLNMLFLVLILSEIPNSIKRYRLDKSVHNLIDFRFDAATAYNPKTTVADSLKPDIYFILFDAMASSKSMLPLTGKSVTDLDNFLQQKGFYIVSDAASNYNFTLHSVSTTFNMEYLPSWIAPVMSDPKTYFWGGNSIKDNSLFRILSKEGYSIKSYQPISFDNPDWPADPYFLNLKTHHFFFKTLPGRIYRDIFWNYSKINMDIVKKYQFSLLRKRQTEKKRLLDTTAYLVRKSCSATASPKFVYAHFMIPHDPYVFDSTGHLLPVEQTIVQSDSHALSIYYGQYRYASSLVQSLVNYIQEHNKKNTVIIVAGDHGCKIENQQTLPYRFNNYSAFYFPDRSYTMLYKNISPVNSFRVLLNKYFHANYSLLADSSIVVTGKKESIKKGVKIAPGNKTD